MLTQMRVSQCKKILVRCQKPFQEEKVHEVPAKRSVSHQSHFSTAQDQNYDLQFRDISCAALCYWFSSCLLLLLQLYLYCSASVQTCLTMKNIKIFMQSWKKNEGVKVKRLYLYFKPASLLSACYFYIDSFVKGYL